MGSERDAAFESDGEVAVELDGVTKRYGETTAVDDVTLRVREGEFFTLVGPSGCGKTTTLRLIAGFEEPTSGTVRFAGASVAGVPPEDRDVGVVFQSYALFPHMTVGENVAYGLNFADPPEGVTRDERVAELLDLVDLPDAADRDPESLSGGQQQRVAMARALAPGPDVLLLDEPMSALDARLRERLRAQVKRIQSELDITTIYVTHDQEEALAISDRVAVMNDGAPEQVAAPRTVYRQPATRFVAEFVGDNNVFAGTVTDASAAGELAVEVDGGDGTLRVRTDDDPGAAPSVGDRIAFCVRPENLRVAGADGGPRDAAAPAGENALRATVASAEFLGETTRVTLDWGDRELVVRVVDPIDGAVAVGFDPEDAHVIGVESR
ncbi:MULTISPECIES: ABC transporter ATP-binding protein [unclassified Halorubrum]|uniref:ABC transporter ATP-binding protein n=1 Tax=unclassified Halorubrum TaxID=2642239 RepID=UPI0010FA266E|nr:MULTISPECIES: ABC transporter ATP-binding protein [unclassified Halorubrum]TKX43378.1 ABC transporter ATP-binding protein [Halorubrum sp. ARQ200]TKX49794.1 ABC transporter ATP-binding protein [Halorubrum sp. ASP121]